MKPGWWRIIAVCFLATGLNGMTAKGTATTMRITELRCEARIDPINVETTAPRFSWILSSEERGQRQTAWQVLAATRPELLQPGRADLWDSNRQPGDQSIHIPYAGKPLQSNQTVYWTARAWDTADQPTAWAPLATFRTAILNSAEWKAQWIGTEESDEKPKVPIETARWIWAETGDDSDGAPRVPAGELRIFRKAIHLNRHVIPTTAVLSIAADNEAQVWVNGQQIAKTTEWEQVRQFEFSKHLNEGRNTFVVAVRNGGRDPNPAGLLALISMVSEGQEDRHWGTDENWLVSPPADSQALADEADLQIDPLTLPDYKPARVLGPWKMRPWASVALATEAGPRPIFRKEFAVSQQPARAVIHIAGLGHHKLFVNGQEASPNFLDPAWAKYEKTVFYSTYDITSLLKKGTNALGVMLANGFYNTAGDRRVNHNHDVRPLTLIAQAHIESSDGSSDVIVTDDSWLWRNGPYTHTSILGGVDYDAGELSSDWAAPGGSTDGWNNANPIQPQHDGELTAAIAPPMRTFEEFDPVHIDEPEPGIFVYDFGQNASATPRLKVRGPAGTTLRLTYSEQRHGATPAHNNGKGRADQSGIRSPNYLEYTLRGGEEENWFPDLFYSGYQYIELTGAVPAGRPNPDNLPVVTGLKSVHVRTDCEPAGTFACSDPMYERIDKMVDWSVRSNLGHVLTDCPHREKMGWLEVIHLMWPSIAARYNLQAFGTKVARDVRDSQGQDGIIYTTAPNYATFQDGFQYTPEWGAAGVLVPWYTYHWYGDDRVLRDNYDCMRDFVDYMQRTSKDLVPVAGLGDWYDYGHGEGLGPSRFTPTELTAMATFGDCARTVAKAARVLGNTTDAEKYNQLADDIAVAFNRHFEKSSSEYQNNGSPQTANAIALVTGQVPAEKQRAKVDGIVADMEKRGWLQTAGDVGFHYLVRALADWGRSDAIFNMLARDELGSYRYLVNAGWTSLPESWDATRSYSMNHCMLGHIQEWFSQDLVGIKPDPEATAFKRFTVAPVTDGPVTSATGTLNSPYGKIACCWDRTEDVLRIWATVPVNTEALLRLPATAKGKGITEGGKPLAEANGLSRQPDNGAGGAPEFLLRSGNYAFEIK